MAFTELDNNPSLEVSEVKLIWEGWAATAVTSCIKHINSMYLLIGMRL